VAGVLLAGLLPGGRGQAVGQLRQRPEPEIYHWVLPAQHSGVEVADLHPHDCYVIQRAEGMVYFGQPWPELLELQQELGEPLSHTVDSAEEHPECLEEGCLELGRVEEALMALVEADGDTRDQRSVRHRPVPIDGLSGGAYSDVGSDQRPRYRRAPEQRMAYLHLGTARRGNCYEAKVPRTLSIHVRDHNQRTDRTGWYSGYLYIEHHHDAAGERVAAVAAGERDRRWLLDPLGDVARRWSNVVRDAVNARVTGPSRRALTGATTLEGN
jgi:hypothetical protein